MITKVMQDAINEQIAHEFGSEYLYLSMAAYFHAEGLDGMAQWMHTQAAEEHVHGMKFFTHLNDRDGRVILAGFEKPQADWKSPIAAFQAALEHEQFITGRIDNLVRLAQEQKDNGALALLQWFVTEQVEEEATATKVIQSLKLVGDNGMGLLMLDRELGARLSGGGAEADAAE